MTPTRGIAGTNDEAYAALRCAAIRLVVVAAALLAVAAACSPAKQPPQLEAEHGSGEGDCKKNIDCGQAEVCIKTDEADLVGRCTPLDCAGEPCCGSRICEPPGLCDPTNPGASCAAGEACLFVDGVPICSSLAEIGAASTCRFGATRVITRDGATPRLDVAGLRGDGTPAPLAVFTTTSPLLDAQGTAHCDGPAPCRDVVVATAFVGMADVITGAAGATCSVPVVVVPGVVDAALLVAAFDVETGAPLAGARVVVTKDDLRVEAVADAEGFATFAVAAPDLVTADAADHARTTVVAPTSRVVGIGARFVLDRALRAGGQGTVDFDAVHTQGDIRVSIAGLSSSRAAAAPSPASIFGPTEVVVVDIEGVTNGPAPMDLPSSSVLELGTSPIKPTFTVSGAPGHRLVWAIGGKVRLAEIGPIISEVTATPHDDDELPTAIAPFFSRFDHALELPLDVVPRDSSVPLRPVGSDGVASPNTLLSQSVVVAVPLLPFANVVGVVGVDAPGFGFVPLGVTAGADDPDDPGARDDGLVDWQPNGSRIVAGHGELIFDFAPPHDGLEGAPMVAMLFALDPWGLRDDDAPISALVRVAASLSVAPPVFDAFLAVPNATFDGKSGVLEIAASPDADVVAIDVLDAEAAPWRVLLPATTTKVDLGALDDRTWVPSTAARVRVTAYRLDLRPGCPATYDDVVDLGGGDALEACAEAWARTTRRDGEGTP